MDGGGDRDRAPPCCRASSRVSCTHTDSHSNPATHTDKSNMQKHTQRKGRFGGNKTEKQTERNQMRNRWTKSKRQKATECFCFCLTGLQSCSENVSVVHRGQIRFEEPWHRLILTQRSRNQHQSLLIVLSFAAAPLLNFPGGSAHSPQCSCWTLRCTSCPRTTGSHASWPCS